jgi:hypothetical protein
VKIAIETKYQKSCVEVPGDDLTMDEVVVLLKQCLLAHGYYSETINKYFVEEL